MERWIFLLVLASIAVVVLHLLRKASRPEPQRDAVLQSPQTTEFKEIALSPLPEPKAPAPFELPMLAAPPQKIVPPSPAPTTSLARAARRPKKKPRKKAAPASLTPSPTPVSGVLDMLKKRDSLPAAWLLGEIFAAPRSRRRR